MSKPITVIGAGLAGLLAGSMLRGRLHGIVEAKESLPNNHSAVLRFRSSIVGDTVGIKFKEVQAIKAVAPWRNPIADMLSYSLKTNGSATMRSSVSANGEISKRYIAPPDFIARLAAQLEGEIEFGQMLRTKSHIEPMTEIGPVISTMPMHLLMELLQYPDRHQYAFNSKPGWNVRARLEGVEAYCSLYIPDPSYPGSRISITGNELVIECYEEISERQDHGLLLEACNYLGLRYSIEKLIPGMARLVPESIEVKKQPYAKILPINDHERKKFIMWASDNYGVYSLGRFATWRPGLLLDDVVQDVRVILDLIDGGKSTYDHRK